VNLVSDAHEGSCEISRVQGVPAVPREVNVGGKKQDASQRERACPPSYLSRGTGKFLGLQLVSNRMPSNCRDSRESRGSKGPARILFLYDSPSPFVLQDLSILETEYEVDAHQVSGKFTFRQVFHALRRTSLSFS